MRKFSRIFLVGFRATGKSTLGKMLADKLNWSFIDLDFLIFQQEGVDIGKLTKNGTDWTEFRRIENEALKDVLVLENAVISCGGGVGVNDIVDEKTKKTFGQLNQKTLQENKENLVILLTSEDKTIKKRLTMLFQRKKIMPFINEKNALKSNDVNDKENLVIKQVEDSMQALIKRKPRYEKMADIEIDTDHFTLPKTLVNVYSVIGDPINHSLSPKMHNNAYKALGIEEKNLFIPIRVNREGLGNFIEAAKLIGLKGISVTVPHKEKIMKYLDEVDETAKKIGSVNTILNVQGKLIGYNTDWIGAITALEEKINLKDKKVAVIGAGGASRAIIYGLVKKGAKVKIFNRSMDKARKLAKVFKIDTGKNMEEIRDYDIIINATSVGMNENKSPVNKNFLNKNQIVFDIVYSLKETKLLKEAKKKGAKIIFGYKMLLHQGTEQFKMYTGFEAPVEKMEEVLK